MIRSLRAVTIGTVLTLGTLVLASGAGAQELLAARDQAGPTLESARAGFSRVAQAPVATEEMLQARRGGLSSGQKLMILGGATFLVGALIGDDAGTVIMVGGAAIGLYGMYLWLNEGATGVRGSVALP